MSTAWLTQFLNKELSYHHLLEVMNSCGASKDVQRYRSGQRFPISRLEHYSDVTNFMSTRCAQCGNALRHGEFDNALDCCDTCVDFQRLSQEYHDRELECKSQSLEQQDQYTKVVKYFKEAEKRLEECIRHRFAQTAPALSEEKKQVPLAGKRKELARDPEDVAEPGSKRQRLTPPIAVETVVTETKTVTTHSKTVFDAETEALFHQFLESLSTDEPMQLLMFGREEFLPFLSGMDPQHWGENV